MENLITDFFFFFLAPLKSVHSWKEELWINFQIFVKVPNFFLKSYIYFVVMIIYFHFTCAEHGDLVLYLHVLKKHYAKGEWQNILCQIVCVNINYYARFFLEFCFLLFFCCFLFFGLRLWPLYRLAPIDIHVLCVQSALKKGQLNFEGHLIFLSGKLSQVFWFYSLWQVNNIKLASKSKGAITFMINSKTIRL